MSQDKPVVKRYFKIVDELVIQKLVNIYKANQEVHKAYVEFCEKVGANGYWMNASAHPAGFRFEYNSEQDPLTNVNQAKLWKKLKNGTFYPKKNSKEGKALIAEIQSLPAIQYQDDCIQEYFGIPMNVPLFIEGFAGYCATLNGFVNTENPEKFIGYVIVPYKEYSDEEISEYLEQKDNPEKRYWSGEMNQAIEFKGLLNNPKGLKEVKEWEIIKEIESEKELRTA